MKERNTQGKGNIIQGQGREILGTGGCLNTHHGGESKKPTESQAIGNMSREHGHWEEFKGRKLDKNGNIVEFTEQRWVRD